MDERGKLKGRVRARIQTAVDADLEHPRTTGRAGAGRGAVAGEAALYTVTRHNKNENSELGYITALATRRLVEQISLLLTTNFSVDAEAICDRIAWIDTPTHEMTGTGHAHEPPRAYPTPMRPLVTIQRHSRPASHATYSGCEWGG